MPDWKDKSSYERLLAALLAAHPGLKVDYRKTATYFGQGATYDSIEGRFRPIRKNAEQMRRDMDTGVLQEAPQRGSASTTSTPRKPRTPKHAKADSKVVLGGRVAKSVNTTPTKKTGVRPNGERITESFPDACSSKDMQVGSGSDTSASYGEMMTASFQSHLMSFQDSVLVDDAADTHMSQLDFWADGHIV